MPSQPYNGVGIQAALTIDATAGGIALTIPTDTNPEHMLLTVETAAIRWWADGTAPTAANGHLLEAGDVLEWMDEGNYRSVIERFRAIRQGGVSGTVQVSFYD